jgi:hypothetical protein
MKSNQINHLGDEISLIQGPIEFSDTHHKEVCEEDPGRGVLLGEDEVEHEPDDGELDEGARDGVEHLALDPQALREAERDGQGDRGGGGERLEHAHQEVPPEARRPQVRLRRRQLLQQHRRVLHLDLVTSPASLVPADGCSRR